MCAGPQFRPITATYYARLDECLIVWALKIYVLGRNVSGKRRNRTLVRFSGELQLVPEIIVREGRSFFFRVTFIPETPTLTLSRRMLDRNVGWNSGYNWGALDWTA